MGIEISIKAGADASTSSVIASGSVSHTITDKELKSFGIENGAFKIGMIKAFNEKFGFTLNEKRNFKRILFHSPTTSYDPYKCKGWPEVTVELAVLSMTIMGITSEPVIVAKQTFTNNSNKTATFDAHISDQVTNTTESNWSKTDTIDVTQMIKYNLKFLGSGGGGETSMEYSHSWGHGGSESKEITVGTTTGVEIPLNPEESVDAVLSASRGIMKVRIVYGACLSGSVAVTPDIFIYNDHAFAPIDIDSVMKSAGLLNNITFTEDIEIGYFSNSKVDIRNA